MDNANSVATCTFVLISPYLMAPLVQKLNLPYKNMQWVVGKALAGKPASFYVGDDAKHKRLWVERTLDSTRRNPGAVSTYDLHVKACNPSCAEGD